MLSVADSLALANAANAGCWWFARERRAKHAVLRVRDLLQRTDCNLVGVVFNCINPQLEHYYTTSGAQYSKLMNNYYLADTE